MLPNLQITSFYPSTKEKKNPTCFFALTGSACATSTPRHSMLYDSNKGGNGQRFKAVGS